MSNPYSPPQASVGDVGAPPALPRWVRVLRGVAVVGSALVALTFIPVATVIPPPDRLQLKFLFFMGGMFVFGAVNILALTSPVAPRLVFRSALAVNCAMLAFLGYRLFVAGRNAEVALIFAVPALLNFAALEALRRARARLVASSAGPL